jgi:hypothetical protein
VSLPNYIFAKRWLGHRHVTVHLASWHLSSCNLKKRCSKAKCYVLFILHMHAVKWRLHRRFWELVASDGSRRYITFFINTVGQIVTDGAPSDYFVQGVENAIHSEFGLFKASHSHIWETPCTVLKPSGGTNFTYSKYDFTPIIPWSLGKKEKTQLIQ